MRAGEGHFSLGHKEMKTEGVEGYVRLKVSLPLFGMVGQLTITFILMKCFLVLMKSGYRGAF